MSRTHELVEHIELPKMAKVRQLFPRPTVTDIAATLRNELLRKELADSIQPGMTIGITGGSRGVAHIAEILHEIAAFCIEKGAKPFIFPAMGSHGGATAQGQVEILNALGITESACGCPIRASMDTVYLGETSDKDPVYFDRLAFEADGYIAVNRIKPHTAFRGPYESGLMKMLTIGCGKQRGAEACHRDGFKYMYRQVPECGKVIIQKTNLLFGVGIVENAFDETALICGLTPEEIVEKEPLLLEQARQMMGRLYFPEVDVLIIDEIGKNISGDGADPNVAGQQISPYASGGIQAQARVALNLTPATHGNASGVGALDVITRRLFEQIDYDATYANAITNTLLHVAKVPMIMDSDRDAIALALKSCHEIDREHPKILRIKNTAQLEEIYISESLKQEAVNSPNIELISNFEPFSFDKAGNLF